MRYTSILLVALLSGCAGSVQRPEYGYMVPICQGFLDRGQFDVHAQCSQSVKNIEGQVGQSVIMSIIHKFQIK